MSTSKRSRDLVGRLRTRASLLRLGTPQEEWPTLAREIAALTEELSTNGAVPATTRNGAGRQVTATPASTVRPRPIRWLWRGRVPLGAVTLIPGRQGLGKSTLVYGLAAQLSRGELDGDLQGEPADVLLVSYEDHAETTIVPRLLAAGADLTRVHILSASEDGIADLISLPGDLERIADHAREIGASAVAVDPVVASLPGAIDAHRDQDVRRGLAPLAQFAEAADVAIVATIHLRKGAASEALDRVSGSIAFTAAARSVLAFGADPADEGGPGRVLAHAKCNVGPPAPSLAYRIEPETISADGEEIATSRLRLIGECDAEAREILSPPAPADRTDTEAAADFIADELADGEWHPSRELKARARQADHAARTIERAAKQLGVEVERRGFPAVSNWRLAVAPGSAAPLADGDSGATEDSRTQSGISIPPTPESRQGACSGATGANRSEAEIERLIAVADEEVTE